MRKTGPDMQKTSPWLIAARVIFTFALIACIVFIFSNSMQIGDVSESASGRVLLLMKKVFTRLGMPGVANHLTDHIVRKLAHFCEYALEGFLLTLCLRVYTRHFFVHISGPILGGLLTALTRPSRCSAMAAAASSPTSGWIFRARWPVFWWGCSVWPCAGCAGCSTNIETRIDAMTIEQANEYFSSLPEGFAPAEELRAALTADVQKVQFVGVAGTAGKTAAAGLLAAILREAAFHVGFYRAGCEPLSARIAIGGVSVDPVLFCQAAEALSAAKALPREAAELAAAARCFGAAGCKLAVVELPDAGLASALPQMPVCAVTAIGPDGVSRSVERLAALAAGVMRKDAVCVTAPEQPKAVLSELVVAAAKAECELVVPDAEDITFLEAEKFTSKGDYGGYTAPLAFLGRHAAGNAAVAVELALALWRKGFEIPDEAILAGLAAVENRSSIRVLSQKPLIILDACRTPQQAAALLRVLNMAKVRHMSAVIGLTEEEGAESFLAALETGLTSEEQKKDKSTMPGMGENPFDKVFLVAPAGTEAALAERLTEKARYHFDAVFCPTLAEAVEQAKANSRRGLLVCGSEAIALEAEKLLENR